MDIDLEGHESRQKVLHVSGYLRFQSAHVPTYPCFPAFEPAGAVNDINKIIYKTSVHIFC